MYSYYVNARIVGEGTGYRDNCSSFLCGCVGGVDCVNAIQVEINTEKYVLVLRVFLSSFLRIYLLRRNF